MKFSLISMRSLKTELAVSIPPAPFPIIVCAPECSDLKVTAFKVPLTHIGSSFDIGMGLTKRLSLSQLAINFNDFLSFAALIISS